MELLHLHESDVTNDALVPTDTLRRGAVGCLTHVALEEMQGVLGGRKYSLVKRWDDEQSQVRVYGAKDSIVLRVPPHQHAGVCA